MIIQTLTIAHNDTELTLGQLTATGGDLYGYTLTEAEIDPAPVIVSQHNLPLVAGGIVSGGRYGTRTVRMRGYLVARSADESNQLRRQLVGVLRDHGEAEFITVRYISESVERELTGLLDGAVEFRPAGGHYVEYSATIVCGDPVAYSTTTSTGTAGSSPGTSVTTSGDARVWPRLTIGFTNSAVTAVRVGNSTTGFYLEVSGITVTTSSELLVDMTPGYESVILDGVSVLNKLTTGSRFWYLEPGTNLVYRTTTGASNAATVTLEWRAGWVS